MNRVPAFILALLLLPLPAPAETIAVIVNRDNPVGILETGDVRDIYTNSTLSWPDGAPISIYDLSVQDPLRALFSEKVLGKNPSKVAEEWAHLKITNQAKNPPTAVKSEALIIRRVGREKGAIGYVSLGSVKGNQDIKVVITLQ